jgi:single-strand DNA-binding protein
MDAEPSAHVNEVHLVGRVSGDIRETTMPSGDVMARFHWIVERSAKARRERPRAPAVDALGCTAWSASSRRTLAAVRPGDVLEVTGSLRRRFQRGAATPTSWYDVEVTRVKRRSS